MKTELQNESEDNLPLGLCTQPEHTRHNQSHFLHAWTETAPRAPQGLRHHWNPVWAPKVSWHPIAPQGSLTLRVQSQAGPRAFTPLPSRHREIYEKQAISPCLCYSLFSTYLMKSKTFDQVLFNWKQDYSKTSFKSTNMTDHHSCFTRIIYILIFDLLYCLYKFTGILKTFIFKDPLDLNRFLFSNRLVSTAVCMLYWTTQMMLVKPPPLMWCFVPTLHF